MRGSIPTTTRLRVEKLSLVCDTRLPQHAAVTESSPPFRFCVLIRFFVEVSSFLIHISRVEKKQMSFGGSGGGVKLNKSTPLL